MMEEGKVCHTPTDTSIGETETDLRHYSLTLDTAPKTCPWQGGTFIIRDLDKKLAIILKNGMLSLQRDDGTFNFYDDRGSHWVCVEKDGWLGFYNAVSGTYMGYNNTRQFIATARQHKPSECFCAQRHPHGGYVLQSKHDHYLYPMRIATSKEEGLVVDREGKGGTMWEFVKV